MRFFYVCGSDPKYCKPIGCATYFLGYSISASVFSNGFRVFKNSENLDASIRCYSKGGFVLDIYGDRFFCKSYENACHCLLHIVIRDELLTDGY